MSLKHITQKLVLSALMTAGFMPGDLNAQGSETLAIENEVLFNPTDKAERFMKLGPWESGQPVAVGYTQTEFDFSGANPSQDTIMFARIDPLTGAVVGSPIALRSNENAAYRVVDVLPTGNPSEYAVASIDTTSVYSNDPNVAKGLWLDVVDENDAVKNSFQLDATELARGIDPVVTIENGVVTCQYGVMSETDNTRDTLYAAQYDLDGNVITPLHSIYDSGDKHIFNIFEDGDKTVASLYNDSTGMSMSPVVITHNNDFSTTPTAVSLAFDQQSYFMDGFPGQSSWVVIDSQNLSTKSDMGGQMGSYIPDHLPLSQQLAMYEKLNGGVSKSTKVIKAGLQYTTTIQPFNAFTGEFDVAPVYENTGTQFLNSISAYGNDGALFFARDFHGGETAQLFGADGTPRTAPIQIRTSEDTIMYMLNFRTDAVMGPEGKILVSVGTYDLNADPDVYDTGITIKVLSVENNSSISPELMMYELQGMRK